MTWQPHEVLHSPISVLSLLFLAFPAYIGLKAMFGFKKASLLWMSIGIFGICIETIGIYTGFPYGTFLYTNPLGGLLFGYAPWALILAWPPLVIGAWVMSHTSSSTTIQHIIIGTALLVCFDLVMDPGAVALGFWSFIHGGYYYHVPYTNFLGWVFSGAISISLIELYKRYTNTQPALSRISSNYASLGLYFSTALWTGVAAGHRQIVPLCIGIILFIWIYRTQYRY